MSQPSIEEASAKLRTSAEIWDAYIAEQLSAAGSDAVKLTVLVQLGAEMTKAFYSALLEERRHTAALRSELARRDVSDA